MFVLLMTNDTDHTPAMTNKLDPADQILYEAGYMAALCAAERMMWEHVKANVDTPAQAALLQATNAIGALSAVVLARANNNETMH